MKSFDQAYETVLKRSKSKKDGFWLPEKNIAITQYASTPLWLRKLCKEMGKE